jgi:hypothetical protein
MTREESYRILKLKPGATEQEIRRQFKRLAMKVHPDINPDPSAHEQFIQLTKAMEVAINPPKVQERIKHTPGDKTTRASRNETEEEIKARMQEAKMRYEQQRKRQEFDDHHYFTQLTSGPKWHLFRAIVVIGIVLSSALALDGLLPTRLVPDKMLAYSMSVHNGILHDKICRIELENRGLYFATMDIEYWAASYPNIGLETTRILHTPVSIRMNDDFEKYTSGIDFHVGSVRWLLVLLFLVPLIPYKRQRKNLNFVFFYQFSFWGIGLFELYFLFTDERLKHLITLGLL